MRGSIWFMAWAMALIGLASIGASAVNPNGQYTLSGNYTWKDGAEVIKGTHSGSMTLNNLKFYGSTTADGSAVAQCRFTLNRKPSSTSESERTVTGTMTVNDQGSPTVYDVFQGELTFRITVTNRIKYAGTVKGRCNSGVDTGAVLALTCKGVK
ncbi:MAG: hypothetical protein IT445_04690 [Phycisphaeraceae bacterium]|nr:hypothetical protein [Phycisphaeraceae bacterium]